MKIKNIIFMFLLASINLESFNPFNELSAKQQKNILTGFLISYFVSNLEALKSYNHISHTYKISNPAKLFILITSLINIFKKNDSEEGTHNEKHWNFRNIEHINELLNNASSTASGSILGILLPPLVEIPNLISKQYNLLSK